MRVLVVNAGSSSLKLAVLDHEDSVLATRELSAPEARIDRDAVAAALADLPDADAVGHRIVHGGERFAGPVRLDAAVEAALRELVDLAPLHQPKSLAALDAITSLRPELPAVAAFDTAFHRTLSAAASTYALPEGWRGRYGLRRYGFHGLSHAYAARRAAELTARSRQRFLVITCHLGAGGSLAAVRDGKSVDTTMGFTPLEGLVMATRSGSIDPGLLTWLITDRHLDPRELADALEHRSGLMGLSGTADMRELLGREDSVARLAVDVYIRSLRAGIGAMATALGGLDAIVFTGGVGENSPKIRSFAADGLAFLGIAVDPRRNENGSSDRDISADDASVRTLVIAAREDLEIARQVREVLEK
ncbi:MAG: acetate/propionate family kinase [Solirubrobacterales bacterium]|nr:acetate/propionate family kinase [Solirubrobacterales bacterium]